MKDRNAAFRTKEIAFTGATIRVHIPDLTEEKTKKFKRSTKQFLKTYYIGG